VVSNRTAKDALFDAFAEVAKALASGRRAEIADLLAQGERPVEEIAAEIGQSVANTSHHLRAMARAGLARLSDAVFEKDGKQIPYRTVRLTPAGRAADPSGASRRKFLAFIFRRSCRAARALRTN